MKVSLRVMLWEVMAPAGSSRARSNRQVFIMQYVRFNERLFYTHI